VSLCSSKEEASAIRQGHVGISFRQAFSKLLIGLGADPGESAEGWYNTRIQSKLLGALVLNAALANNPSSHPLNTITVELNITPVSNYRIKPYAFVLHQCGAVRVQAVPERPLVLQLNSNLSLNCFNFPGRFLPESRARTSPGGRKGRRLRPFGYTYGFL
jgi:hypothetical protein